MRLKELAREETVGQERSTSLKRRSSLACCGAQSRGLVVTGERRAHGRVKIAAGPAAGT